jgi:hypothetical protein
LLPEAGWEAKIILPTVEQSVLRDHPFNALPHLSRLSTIDNLYTLKNSETENCNLVSGHYFTKTEIR